MKFGTIIEQKMLDQMTPRSLQADISFKVNLKVIYCPKFYIVFDLEINVWLG